MRHRNLFEQVAIAGKRLATVSSEQINALLLSFADETEATARDIIEANKMDLALIDPSDPRYDRLKLTPEGIRSIAAGIRNIASLPSPLGDVLERRVLPNGLEISKISVPFGVIGVIYEARPNVTFDVFSLCVKSGNACILKGGSDASHSNEAIIGLIKRALTANGLDTSLCEMLPSDRDSAGELLSARGLVDVIIPRGGKKLIDYVVENAKVPVIETGAGIVHTYLDSEADLILAAEVIRNAKTRRVSVCNALDCLIVNEKQLFSLPEVVASLAESRVVIYADDLSFASLKGSYPEELLEKSTLESYGTEFLDYKMAVKTVPDLDRALEHICKYSSKHSEAIISTNEVNIKRFLDEVDAAAVYSNTSTAFTDGAQFGLGAETGISTQKLHARGPMGLRELTSYKWVIRGKGQVRE